MSLRYILFLDCSWFLHIDRHTLPISILGFSMSKKNQTGGVEDMEFPGVLLKKEQVDFPGFK